MKIVGCLILAMLASSRAATDEIWPILWPLNDCAIADQVHIGYGDWCTIDPPVGEPEGPHPGIDFGAVLDDIVRNPGLGVVYSLGFGTTGSAEENLLVLGCDWPQDQGWTLGHIFCDNPQRYWNTDPGQGPVADWDPGEAISYCGLASGQTDPWRHLHLSWVEDWVYPPPEEGYFVPGFTDPFEHIMDDLAGLYVVMFKRVYYEENLLPDGTSGTWFMPDGYEEQNQFSSAPGHPYWVDFQTVICGDVDVAVSPYSAYLGDPARDSMGVYSVGYTVDWINPYTETFESTESVPGNWHQRWLCRMEGELPPGDTSPFRAIFLDGSLPDGSGTQLWDRFESAYIVTNSGAREPSEWDDGWDNVETAPGSSDWEDAICRGAWDTNLAIRDLEVPSETRNAKRNEEAFFPDGRYAVDVTAVSQGSRDIGEMRLPVEDITDPESPVRGIVVDNFPPHIVEVYLYAENEERAGAEVEYSAAWITGLDPAIAEEIRDLELQLEEMRNPGSYVPLPEYSMAIDPASGVDPLRAIPFGLEHQSAVGVEVAGNPDPVASQHGIDPVTFIQARLDSLRGLDVEVLRYLVEDVTNYPDLTQDFGIVVKYSEPMIEEDPEGREVVDRIWLEGTQGDEIVWESGAFEAQERMFWPDADGLPPGPNWSAGRLEQAQGFWRVYEYVGAPAPEGFNGMLTLCVGYDESSDELDGPRDLAGNALDGNPGTISATREGYGPWIGPDGPVPRYEPRVDAHCSWGELHWISFTWPIERYFEGYCEEDLIESIDLVEVGVGLCEDFFGDCGYNCGFWVYQEIPGRRDFDIQAILPDETYENFHFRTQYPVEDGTTYPQWWHWSRKLSNDGRYCWMSGFDLEPFPSHRSTGYIYAVDAATGATLSMPLCNGLWWGQYGGQYDWTLYASFIEILSVYSTGHAFVRCMYYPVVAGDPVIEYQLIAPPVPEPPSSESGYATADSSGMTLAAPVISLRSNPVDSSIEILVPDVAGTTIFASLFDLTGRVVLEMELPVTAGDGEVTIDVGNVPSGVYHLRIEGGSFSEMMSVTVIH